MTSTELKRQAWKTRIEIIKMLTAAQSGHAGGPLGISELLTALYFRFLQVNPRKPRWPGRDRFVLSAGHLCPALYATLAAAGFFKLGELTSFRALGSRLQGHTHNLSTPGVETTGGPLGQGISQAVGMALGFKMDRSPQRVWCLSSDGEQNEGQTWEAAMFAAKEKLDNLIMIIDRNNIQISGPAEQVMPLEPLKEKYESFGWYAVTIDGNDMDEVISTFEHTLTLKGQPLVIIARTVPGKGVSFMENNYLWHGKAPKPEEAEVALLELERAKRKIT